VASDAERAGPSYQPRPKRRAEGWFRTTIPATTMCFILCMCCKVYIGDSFVLHTSSMEPTMVGRRGGGDRIVISKLHTALRAPERWDVLLFRYPNNLTTRYMKRLVGMGGEQLFIRGGDLWISDHSWAGSLEDGRLRGRVTVVRKPAPTQESFLDMLPVVAAAELADFDESLWRRHCEVVEGESAAWAVHDAGHVSAHADAGPAVARMRREARDVILDARVPATRQHPSQPVAGGKHPVGDLSFRIDVRPRSPGAMIIVQVEDSVGGHVITAELTVNAPPPDGVSTRSRVLIDGRSLGTSDAGLSLDVWSSVRFDNIDDRVRLVIDGEPILVRDYGHPVVGADTEATLTGSRAGFGVLTGCADFRPVALHRDISYEAQGTTRFLIPEDHYVVLGDNTGASADSRSWKRVAIRLADSGEIMQGDAHGVTSSSTMLHESNPWMEPDGTYSFADRSGAIHSLQNRRKWTEVGILPSPYVRREWIIGRGVCVLWPLNRFSWLR